MRTEKISIKSDFGSNPTYLRQGVGINGYGFRLRPFFDDGIIVQDGTGRPDIRNPNLPGAMPVRVVVKENIAPNYGTKRGPLFATQVEREMWIRDGRFYSFPNGFASLDVYAPAPLLGSQGHFSRPIPFNSAELELSYLMDIAEAPGEVARDDSKTHYGSFSPWSSTTGLRNHGANGAPAIPNPQSVADLYSGGFNGMYVAEPFARLTAELQSSLGTESLILWVSSGGLWTPAEVIPNTEWNAVPGLASTWRMSIARDMAFTNQWIALTASAANVLCNSMAIAYEVF